MINEQDKQRIEKALIEKEAEDIVNTHYQNKLEGEAEAYADSVDRRGCSFWRGLKMGYIAGRGELERSEKLLQEERNRAIDECFRLVEDYPGSFVRYTDWHDLLEMIKALKTPPTK